MSYNKTSSLTSYQVIKLGNNYKVSNNNNEGEEGSSVIINDYPNTD